MVRNWFTGGEGGWFAAAGAFFGAAVTDFLSGAGAEVVVPELTIAALFVVAAVAGRDRESDCSGWLGLGS
ncbi:MAG: hypothetical protein ABEH80_01550 [Halobaculum sp.]